VTPPNELLLPEGTCLVHIGPHKTGSTAIQVALAQAGDRLAGHGVAYVTGAGHRARKAGWSLGIRGRPAGTKKPPIKRWERFVAAVGAATAPRVCVSNEDFGRATLPQLSQVVDDLGGDRVHVVAVARRLDRYLPSQWQERVKAGDERGFEEWLRIVLDTDDPEPDWSRRNVWFSHDVHALVTRWVQKVGAERFTLVLSDESDRDLLPRTFEGLLGLPVQTLQPDPSRSNRGLSWAETELIRAVNQAVADQEWTRSQRRRFLVRGILRDMQSRPTPAGPKSPPFPDWAATRLRELSDQRVEQVRALGVRVVGDPESMRMPDDVPTAPTPLEPPALSIGVAAHAIAAVLGAAIGKGGVGTSRSSHSR
jgi:hypothetical protein